MTVNLRNIAAKLLPAMAATGMALPAGGQDAQPFEINPERAHFQSVQRCVTAGTYIVPSLYLHVSVRNRLTPGEQSKRGKPRIYVEGLEKRQLQELARSLYDDFVARLRASGAKVLTFEDIRADAAQFERKGASGRYGLPIHSESGTAIDYVVAAPSDDQAIDWERDAVTRPYRDLARAHFAAVIVPEITFTLPQTGAKARSTPASRPLGEGTGIAVDPALMFASAMMNGMPQDLRWCNIHVQEHTFRLATESVGRIEPIGLDEPGGGDWPALRSDYAFVVDRQAFDAGVLRVGHAFNALMADRLKGE